MCLDKTNPKIADRDIPIWRVYSWRPIGYAYDIKKTWRNIFDNAAEVTLKSSIAYDALYFSDGYGYTSFRNPIFARIYMKEILKTPTHITDILKIFHLIIPEGSLYAEARIAQGYIGQGLPAVRSEKLKESNIFSPINPDTGKPYFTIKSEGWAGKWET